MTRIEKHRLAVDSAVEYLHKCGYSIIDRPNGDIDLIAWHLHSDDTMAFIAVRQHDEIMNRTDIPASVRSRIRMESRIWKRQNKWSGKVRFDVIHVYGSDNGIRTVDHILNVAMSRNAR